MPKSPHEKAMQRALIQYRNPKNYELVEEALKLAHREDLIGFDKKCLIRPRGAARQGEYGRGTAPRGGATGKGSNGGYTGKPAGKSGGQGTGSRAASGGVSVGKSAPAKKKTIRNVHKKKGK